MFNKKVCEIVIVLDRSGSMSSCKNETIEGVNRLIEEQRKQPGRAKLTVVLFDHEYQVHHESVDLQEVGYVNAETYVPRGQTALWDAVGRTISDADARFEKSPPDQVIFVVVTDGMENASKEFTQQRLCELVEKHTAWKFVFIGANQDAVLTAKSMAFSQDAVVRSQTYDGTRRGTKQAMNYCCSAVSSLRDGHNYNAEEAKAAWDDAAKAAAEVNT